MARRYVRDSRGRFASTSGSKGSNGKRRATSKLRPGEVMNANARPVGVVAKPPRTRSNYGKDRNANVQLFIGNAMASGQFVGSRRVASRGNIAEVVDRRPLMGFQLRVNSRSRWFGDPVGEQRRLRRQGWFSTTDPKGLVAHEVAHGRFKHSDGNLRLWPLGQSGPARRVAGRVSQYAKTNPQEFVAEVAAGLATGRKYDHEVMSMYRAATGRTSRPPARRRSRVRRKPGT